MRMYRALSFIALSMLSASVFANVCLNYFPDPASTSSSVGTISFAANSELIGSDGTIDIGILLDDSSASCETQSCVSSGTNTPAFDLPSFQISTSSADVTVGINSSSTMQQVDLDNLVLQSNAKITVMGQGGTVRIEKLDLSSNAEIKLSAGVYYINTMLLADGANIKVKNGQRAIVYVNDLTIQDGVAINANGDADQLVITAFNDVSIGESTNTSAYIYALSAINIGANGNIYGAVNGETITLGTGTSISYRVANIEQANFNGACGLNALLPTPVMEYTMDMCLTPSQDRGIKDSVGGNDADAWNGIEVDFMAQYCQGARFDGDRTFIDIQDSGLFDLQQGAISFWVNVEDLTFRGNPLNNKIGLFSKDTWESIDDRMTLLVDAAGKFDFRYLGAQETYLATSAVITENTWHHVALTWGPDGIYIYVDGDQEASATNNTTARLSPNGLDLAIGANARGFQLSSNGQRGLQLRDFFKGSFDEFKIFDTQLNPLQIERLFGLAEQSCTSCSNSPVLISHYSNDVCSINANEVIDVVSQNNGSTHNGVSTDTSSRFCQGLSFDGTSAYARVPHSRDFENAGGAVSLWFNIPDLSHSSQALAVGSGTIDGNVLFTKDVRDGVDDGHIDVRIDENGRVRGRHQYSSGTDSFNSGSARVSENTWHHLVYSFGSDGVRIYLDGALVDSLPTVTNGWQNNLADIVIGASSRGWNQADDFEGALSNFLKGDIDDLKIYRNQPSGADVVSWYNDSDYVCKSCSSLVARYTFDSEGITGNVVEDTTANGYDGFFQRDLSIELPSNNKFCRALSVPNDRSVTRFKNFDTRIDLNEIGNQGGVSFWYRSNKDWGSAGPQQLLDATRGNKFFYLSITSTGALSFGAEDEDDEDIRFITSDTNIQAGQWVHITLNWNYDTNKMNILLDGVEHYSGTFNSNIDNIAPYGTLTFGDNKSSYLVYEMTGNAADGFFDDIRIYRENITEAQAIQDMSEATRCNSTLGYVIEHPESALVCGSPSIVIKACANLDCSELSGDPTTVQLFPAASFVQSQVTFTGSTEVQLSRGGDTSSTLTFGSNGQNPVAPVTCSPDCTIDFDDAGLEFFHVASGATNFSELPFTAETPFAQLGLRAVGSNGQSCDALVSEAQDVTISYDCVSEAGSDYSPSSCATPLNGIPFDGSEPHSGTISVVFDANGEASLSALSYADVGLLNLTANATINGAEIGAASTQIKVVPDSFGLSTNAPAKPTAGQTYNVQIQALGAAGGVLPSYRSNVPQLAAKRIAPINSKAVDAAFEFNAQNTVQTSAVEAFGSMSETNFVNGTFSSSTAFFEEVGTYQLIYRDADYLGKSIASTPMNFGQVIPAFLYVNIPNSLTPQLSPAAGTFTYVGQDYGFAAGFEPVVQITAYNNLRQVTRNYSGTAWRLPMTTSKVDSYVSYTDASAYSGDIQAKVKAANIEQTKQSEFNGNSWVRLKGPTLAYTKVASPQGADASPFDALVNINYAAAFFTDLDGVCFQSNYPNGCDSFSINNVSGTQMRYGRLFLENAFGPEDKALRMQAKTQYLMNGRWQTNTQDNSTVLALSQSAGHIDILHDPQSPNDITAGVSGVTANNIVSGGHSQGNDFLFAPVLASGSAQVGSFFVTLSPTSAANDWAAYLNMDWDGDGDIDADDTPSAAISFGLYRANDKTIHWREAF
ncbi:DUF6701 domain-containing protein [Glaciecola siphonariae]|uniref:DUF6701 domain-containing protein n=1 Tax=Glaciecola siphonariae TaxID=521012 RepID=A0ABV9M0B1_9ALTE